MTDSLPSGLTRRTMLKATAATTAGVALFSGSAQASRLFQVNFCGCSQLCIVADHNSNYVIWVGYYDTTNEEWAVTKVSPDPKVEAGEVGYCYTIEEAEEALNLDSDNEAKLIAVTSFEGNYVGNPTNCALKPLEVFDTGNFSVPTFTGFVNDEGTSELDLRFGPYSGIDVVRGGCGEPGKTPGKPEDKGKP